MGSVNLISSGLDVLGIVDNLILVEREPISKLEEQNKTFQSKVSAYQALNSKLLALKTSTDSLLYSGEDALLSMPASFADRFSKSLFALRQASTSDSSVVGATAGKGAATGSYTVTIHSLAAINTYASNNFLSATESDTTTGTLVIQKGSEDAVTITVDETNNTLQGIKDAINSQNAGFTATILNDGSGTPYRLLITSDDSGTANALTITDNLTEGTGSAVSFAETTAAADAEVQINGVDISSGSNRVTDAIEGVTFELKASTGTAVISVERDTDAIVEGLRDFVEKYNGVVSYIASQTRYDTETKSAGILSGDFILRQTQSDLSSLLFRSVNADGGAFRVLAQAGVNLSKDGTITLDESKLKDALASNFDDTARLLLADGDDGEGNTVSLIPALQSRLRSLTDSVDGPIYHASDSVRQTMKRLDQQIEQMEQRLDARREILIAQFTKADEALKQLSVLQNSLTGMINSLQSL